MRLTDDRYQRQRFRLEVAMRMIRHAARTSTIRECTGVTEDRIRKLYRSYFADSVIRRQRGKSPRSTYCLTHNLQARTDAVLMAGIYYMSGLIHELRHSDARHIDPHLAARICDAYEWFQHRRLLLRPSDFSLEHALYLLRELVSGERLIALTCPRCQSLMLQDRLARPLPMCPLCEIKRSSGPQRPRRRNSPSTTTPKPESHAGVQSLDRLAANL